MTEIKTKPFETLEVGKTYVSREGQIVQIDRYEKGWNWPYVSEYNTYIADGSVISSDEPSPRDLIAEVIEKPVYRVKAGSEALYHDPRVTMEQVGEMMAQDGEFSQIQETQAAKGIWVESKPPSTGHVPWPYDYSMAHWKKPTSGQFTPDQYRAALDDFIHGGDSKDTRDVIKDALRVMGGV